MPREIVHWAMLTKAVERLKSTAAAPRVVDCIESRLSAAFLGAVVHDAPYFYKFGGDPFEAAARFLHGEELSDTILPIRVASEVVRRETPIESRDVYWAFLLGMLSHAVADWNFHPMVFYYTGKYDHPDAVERAKARLRHRLFETYLDSWFRPRHSFVKGYRISPYVTALGASVDDVCRLLDQCMVPETFEYQRDSSDAEMLSQLKVRSVEGRWNSAIQYFRVLQTAFLSGPLGAAAALLAKISPGRFSQYEVLFSRGRLTPNEKFSMPLQFKNPVSGELLHTTVDELLETSAEECAEQFAAFEPLLAGSEEAASVLLAKIRGKSLNFGIAGATSKDAKHFAPNGIELPGLEY